MQEFISKTEKPLKFANLNFNLYKEIIDLIFKGFSTEIKA